jgi:hypothetical protein
MPSSCQTLLFLVTNSNQGAIMKDSIGDKSIYLRINELKKRNIQPTDATNAVRLAREHDNERRMGIFLLTKVAVWYMF